MQKKLIVLALAGLASSAAFAQTNVTIYGVIDEFVGYGKASQDRLTNPGTGVTTLNSGGDQSFSGLQSGGLSGSRLGFKGEEGLGNGLKAIFVYELGTLDPTSTANAAGANGANGNNFTKSRQSYVGLTGGWGTAIAGRLQSPGYDTSLKFDPMAASVFSPTLTIAGNNGMTIMSGDAGRLNNAIAYVTPNFSGFSAELAYAFGEQITGTNWNGGTVPASFIPNPNTGVNVSNGFDSAQSVWGGNLNYDNGPLALTLAAHFINNAGGTGNAPSQAAPLFTRVSDLKQTEYQVAGSYDFKMAKLFGSYQYIKQENFASLGQGTNNIYSFNTVTGAFAGGLGSTVLTTGNTTGNLWNIGVNVPVGANGVVKAAYTHYSNSMSNTYNLLGERLNLRDQSVQVFGIDYEYSFSKRTTAYAGYSYLDNGRSTAYGYSAGNVGVTPSADNSAWNIGAGLRHTF